MTLSTLLLILLSLSELVLLAVVILFFVRLKRSEALLQRLTDSQADFMNKLRFSAQLEQEMIETFGKRQQHLVELDEVMERRAEELSRLVKQAEKFIESPALKRELILTGHRRGKGPLELAKATGLTLEEVELIIDQGA
jgi:biopolymer transport protein ExbB/TolQ